MGRAREGEKGIFDKHFMVSGCCSCGMMTYDKKINLGVLISGSGNTLQNFIDQIEQGKLIATIQVAISSKPDVVGLDRARKHGIPTAVVPYSNYKNVDAFSQAITAELDKYPVDLISLAGFVHFYKIPEKYKGKVMNIHPGLIPAFCGHNYYGKKSMRPLSTMVQRFLDARYILLIMFMITDQLSFKGLFPFLRTTHLKALPHGVFREECEAYPEAIRLFAAGRLKIDGKR